MDERYALLCAALVFSMDAALAAGPAEKWAQYDPATQQKFRNLHNQYGTSCCDIADGHLVEDPDWKGPNEDGSFDVRYDGKWVNVEKQRIVQSPTGQALIWRNPSVDKPYCFAPGVQG